MNYNKNNNDNNPWGGLVVIILGEEVVLKIIWILKILLKKLKKNLVNLKLVDPKNIINN